MVNSGSRADSSDLTLDDRVARLETAGKKAPFRTLATRSGSETALDFLVLK
jgi:hypothetical protein